MTQNEVLDSCQPELDGYRTAMSLRPSSESLMLAYALGDPETVAMIDAWRFRFPVTGLPADELEAVLNEVVFYGK